MCIQGMFGESNTPSARADRITSMKFLLLSQTCHVGHLFPETFHQAGHVWHFPTFPQEKVSSCSRLMQICPFTFFVLQFRKIRHTAHASKFDS